MQPTSSSSAAAAASAATLTQPTWGQLGGNLGQLEINLKQLETNLTKLGAMLSPLSKSNRKNDFLIFEALWTLWSILSTHRSSCLRAPHARRPWRSKRTATNDWIALMRPTSHWVHSKRREDMKKVYAKFDLRLFAFAPAMRYRGTWFVVACQHGWDEAYSEEETDKSHTIATLISKDWRPCGTDPETAAASCQVGPTCGNLRPT